MDGMLSFSGISTANYDAILQGWAAQTVQNNINLGAGGFFIAMQKPNDKV